MTDPVVELRRPRRDAVPGLVDAATLPGVPDAFQRLWTPHRMAYINAGADAMRATCPFCAAPGKSDADGLIVHRGRTAYVLLNLFPYNSRPPARRARTGTSPPTTRRRPRRSPRSAS